MTNKITGDYKTFADHPLAPTYFKYIDILIKDDLNKDTQHLLDIAHAPMTDEIRNEITDILSALFRIMHENTDYTNEFIELGKQIDNAH
jgi:hypothetical protein